MTRRKARIAPEVPREQARTGHSDPPFKPYGNRFFSDDTDPVLAPAMGAFAEPPTEAFEADPLHKPETLKFVRASF